jgi:hypothetical protein
LYGNLQADWLALNIRPNSLKLVQILILSYFLYSCSKEEKLFIQIPEEHSTIYFANNLIENEKYNVYDYHNLYNGGGIAAFDVNNDGLIDLYFTGNQVNDKLYLNKGNFVFEDITESAGIIQKGWSTGVTVADINNDGFLDFYVCKAGNESADNLKNLLYINQGNSTFKEEAKEHGLADTSLSTQSAFFDYDKDGDLDCYILTTSNLYRNPNQLRKKELHGKYAVDKLYKNDGLGNYSEVGLASGITENTHGLGLAIADINGDGWEDILASSDFLPNDALYINNQDGTFSNKAKEYLPYQSRFSMGNDIADINNDGLPDMMTVDMLPPDNEQQKKMLMTSYHVFETEQTLSYQNEFTRNMLFQNSGTDINRKSYFNEIGQYSGVQATGWSWAPLLMDLDNDGLKDIYVSNGYMRDVTNSDIISYNMSFANKTESEAELKEFMNSNTLNAPRLKSKNKFFKNKGSLKFSNESELWITQKEGFSNGAIFADLDNDGDLDYVVNNINENAHVFRNESTNNSITLKLSGDAINQGVKVISCIKGKCQTYINSTTRGYLSSFVTPIVIGIGNEKIVDSLRVIWPKGKSQLLNKLKANQQVTFDIKNATIYHVPRLSKETLFTETPFDYEHVENRFIDFYKENLLLRKYSQPGPAIASSDIDNNGYEDVFIGGNSSSPAIVFYQTSLNKFRKTSLKLKQNWEDAGAEFIDINEDGYLDLYTLSGSNEFELNSGLYKDHVYLNDGKGNLLESFGFMPQFQNIGSVLCAIDINRDGKNELFRGAGVLPGKFPEVSDSWIFGTGSRAIDPINMGKLGLITDAKVIDYNKDGWEDLIIIGEYMSPILFINKQGKLEKTNTFKDLNGLWSSLAITDLNGDGFEDVVLGNKGENYRYTFTSEKPLEYHELDLSGTGKTERIQTYYQNGTRYFIPARDELIRQYPYLRTLFPDYASYASIKADDYILGEPQKTANYMKSIILWNKEGKDYTLEELPFEAQTFQVNTIFLEDFNHDGRKDILLAGNDFSAEPINTGYVEGSKSCLLLGQENHSFKYMSNQKSGVWLNGFTKNLVVLKNKENSHSLITVLNNSKAKLYKFNR